MSLENAPRISTPERNPHLSLSTTHGSFQTKERCKIGLLNAIVGALRGKFRYTDAFRSCLVPRMMVSYGVYSHPTLSRVSRENIITPIFRTVLLLITLFDIDIT